MLAETVIRAGRTEDFVVSLFKADGKTPVVLANNDTVRLKVFRQSQPVALDLSSTASTANGSTAAIKTPGGNQVSVRFAQADTASLMLGPYRIEVDVVDANDTAGPANPIKHADWGVLHVLDAGGGTVGL